MNFSVNIYGAHFDYTRKQNNGNKDKSNANFKHNEFFDRRAKYSSRTTRTNQKQQ